MTQFRQRNEVYCALLDVFSVDYIPERFASLSGSLTRWIRMDYFND